MNREIKRKGKVPKKFSDAFPTNGTFVSYLVFVTAELSVETINEFLAMAETAVENCVFYENGSFLILTSATASLDSYNSPSLPDNFSNFNSPFLGCSLEAIQMAWMKLTQPIENEFSMFAMHSFVILDEVTAKDNRTALVVNMVPDGFVAKRASFTSIEAGLLQPIEMLQLDLTQIGGGPAGTIEDTDIPLTDPGEAGAAVLMLQQVQAIHELTRLHYPFQSE